MKSLSSGVFTFKNINEKFILSSNKVIVIKIMLLNMFSWKISHQNMWHNSGILITNKSGCVLISCKLYDNAVSSFRFEFIYVSQGKMIEIQGRTRV